MKCSIQLLHYPLWGIETWINVHLVVLFLNAATLPPLGDWNFRGKSLIYFISPTLPPLGDWNLKRRLSWISGLQLHYPLRGIETVLAITLAPFKIIYYITPSGGLKPLCLQAVFRYWNITLPPLGDWNNLVRRLCYNSLSTLPPLGDWNFYLLFAFRHYFATLPPLGDWNCIL